MGLGFLGFILVAMIVLARSIKIIRENERVIVFRLGHFFGVQGPGVVLLIPFVDKIERVDLNASVPGWRGMSATELTEEVKTIALSRPALS